MMLPRRFVSSTLALVTVVVLSVAGAGAFDHRPPRTILVPGQPVDLARGTPPSALASCKTCPQFDYGSFTPTTIYQTQSGTLAAGSDCRIYRFLVKASHLYRFTFCEGGGNASFDTVLGAFGTQCNALGSNDDVMGCTGGKSQLDVTTAADGYVYLRVTSKFATGGSYTLAYKDAGGVGSGACLTCPTFDYGTFTPTTSYQTHSGSVSPGGGCRIYRFQVMLNHSYRFTTCEGGGATSFATTLQALTGSCGLGPSNTGACGFGSQLDYGAGATGYVFVKVSGASGGGGAYTLAYRDISADCKVCPTFDFGKFRPRRSVTQHSSTVFANGCRTYAFDLGAGVPYHFSLCANGGTATFPASLVLSSASCATVASGNACSGQQVDYTPATTGTYYLRIAPAIPGGGGSYTLAYWSDCGWCDDFDHLPRTPTCLSECDPSAVSSGCTDVWAFDVVGGSKYRFSTCPGCENAVDTKLTALGSSCQVVGTSSTGSCGPPAELTATAPGTGPTRLYLIVQQESGPPSTAFGLTFQVDPTSDRDMDNAPDCTDGCPDDPNKTSPGSCGCGHPDISCDDSDACTTDSCDMSTGACQHVPVPCDDSNPCTADSCDSSLGCQNFATFTCACPIVVPDSLPFSDTRSTEGQPNNSNPSCAPSGSPEVVYRIQSTTTRRLLASTSNTDYDTVLHVEQATCGSGDIACSDDVCYRIDQTSRVAWIATAGVVYYLYVDGWSGEAGDYTLTITAPGNPPGTCASPIVVPNGGQYVDSGNTGGGVDNGTAFCGSTGGPDVVYRIQTTTSRTLTASTCSECTSFDTVLHVHLTTCTGTVVACNDDDDTCDVDGVDTDRHSALTWMATGGVTYFLHVDGFVGSTYFGGGTGNYGVTIDGL